MPNAPDGTSPHNISTEHQKPGDAKRPGDLLDSENDSAHWAKDFDPGEDAGSAEPERQSHRLTRRPPRGGRRA